MSTPPDFVHLCSRQPQLIIGFGKNKTPGVAKTAGRSYTKWNGSLSDTTHIALEAVPWPFSADDNGQAYPSGIVGVRFKHKLNDTDANNLANASLIAVPAVLPAGYTQSFLRFQNLSYGGVANKNAPSSTWPLATAPSPTTVAGTDAPQLGGNYPLIFSPAGGRPICSIFVRTAAGLAPYDWMPQNTGTNAYNSNSGFAPQVDFSGNVFLSSALIAGFRYYKCSFTVAGIGAGSGFLSAVAWRIMRTPSILANPALTDTVVYQSADITANGAYDSGYLYHNGTTQNFYAATEGARSRFWIQIVCKLRPSTTYGTNFGTHGGITSFNNQAGPRLDLALPWVATSSDPMVFAPAGIFAGAVPGY